MDQSKSNLPIIRPEVDALGELLESHFKDMPSISKMQQDLLKAGLKQDRFKDVAKVVIAQLKSSKKFEDAGKLSEAIPIFI